MSKLTPMMQQYLEIKEQYRDALLLYRMGDFYEMFLDDAVAAAPILEIALTSRDRQAENQVPMCGVPYHAADGYIAKLIAAGKKVAICDQVEDPRKAKGLVRREVTRVITPGLILDNRNLLAKQPNYLAAVSTASGGHRYGLAYLDISTGEFKTVEMDSEETLLDELVRVSPKELLVPEDREPSWLETLQRRLNTAVTNFNPDSFDRRRSIELLTEHFRVRSLEGFGIKDDHPGIQAAGAILFYLKANLLLSCPHIGRLVPYTPSDFMVLDDATVRNLDIFQSTSFQSKKGSLLSIIDDTRTAMGGRKLQHWLRYPLLDLESINARQEAVSELVEEAALRSEILGMLDRIDDIERLNSRNGAGASTPRDLVALKRSLQILPGLRSLLSSCSVALLSELSGAWDDLADVAEKLEFTLSDPPPATSSAGGVIRSDVDDQLDRYVRLSRDARSWMADYEAAERQNTGISSLKVRFNKVFGYYIEISKANLASVPERYFRKQTLVNAERYITEELKEFETQVLEADEKRIEIEGRIFSELREWVSTHTDRLQAMADTVALLDCLASFAEIAARYDYCRPRLDDGDVIQICEGRHPVIEHFVQEGGFVPNDLDMDSEDRQVLIITGPNMAGKSTILRQAALIALLAHTGSFVPAASARIGLVDRIFTRVGASDDLARGRSTFMVEMQETANILHQATPKSLVILDEIGRGTSTYDGLSIAWAVAERLHDFEGAGVKTLFATHYHELTELARLRPRVKNFNVAIREWQQEILFFHKLVPGGANRSYGIQVARLAGLPDEVTDRAREILAQLESGRNPFRSGSDGPGPKRPRPVKESPRGIQLNLFQKSPEWLRDRIISLDLDNLTPLAALQTLHALKEQVSPGRKDPKFGTDETSTASGKP